jgi:hypothetical protein
MAILDHNGAVIMREKLIAQGDAELLRKYKKFLQAHGLKEALWCMPCAEAGRPDGLRASVMDGKIDMACRCTTRRYRGQTY